jgi:hypothetical protein
MTTFDDRERAFETKFALDQETDFRALGRRDQLIGRWAAERMGLSDGEVDGYVAGLIAVDLRAAGDEDLIGRLLIDLDGRASEAEVRAKLDELFAVARAEIEAGV